MSWIFVDCEGHGPAPGLNDNEAFEFGAVEFESKQTFHGRGGSKETFESFKDWLSQFEGHPTFISDNPAYDWQFINYYFHKYLGMNPMGHSARRIGDFYAGLMGDFSKTQKWKKWRVTLHDHNPVNDAMGNVEAFEIMIRLSNDSLGAVIRKEVTEFIERENPNG